MGRSIIQVAYQRTLKNLSPGANFIGRAGASLFAGVWDLGARVVVSVVDDGSSFWERDFLEGSWSCEFTSVGVFLIKGGLKGLKTMISDQWHVVTA